MKYLILLLLLSSGAWAAPANPKFHYGERVIFSDEFYGLCSGEIVERMCGSSECSYLVSSSCQWGTDKKSHPMLTVEGLRLFRGIKW